MYRSVQNVDFSHLICTYDWFIDLPHRTTGNVLEKSCDWNLKNSVCNNKYVCISVYLSISLSLSILYLSIYLSIHLYLSYIYLSIYPSIHPSIWERREKERERERERERKRERGMALRIWQWILIIVTFSAIFRLSVTSHLLSIYIYLRFPSVHWFRIGFSYWLL